jgi:single-strand DNA-binding protein
MSIARAYIVGRITRDIESKQAGDSVVAKFGLAVNRKGKDSNGQPADVADFFDCEAWGKTAEFLVKYLGKGRLVLADGTLRQESWTDKDGGKRSKIKVVADRIMPLDSGKSEDPGAAPANREPAAKAPARNDDDGDIPF